MSKAPPDTTYRDARPGAEAKREKLLERARLELAAQPLELRRVFVNRVSSAAAGAALLVGGLLTALVTASGGAYDAVAAFLPGRFPAVTASVIGATGFLMVLGYFVARSVAEEWFTRTMLRAANPSVDVFADLDRLAKTPTDEAHRLARSATLPNRFLLTAGIAAVAAPLALAARAVVDADGYANPGIVDAQLMSLGGHMLGAGCVAFVAALALSQSRQPAIVGVALALTGICMSGFGLAASVWGITIAGLAAGTLLRWRMESQQAPVLARKTPQQDS